MTDCRARARVPDSTIGARWSPLQERVLGRTALVALVVLMFSAGCTSLFPAQPPAVVFDLGEPPRLEQSPMLIPGRIEVRAPSWLDTPAMQYRLAYQLPASRDAYIASKWAAPPAEMMQRMIARTLGIGDDPARPCRLRVELDEFVQVFKDPQVSESRVFARVELIDARGGARLASTEFEISQAAASPDARGGVAAHQNGVSKFISGTVNWLTDVGNKPGGPAQRCHGVGTSAPDKTQE